MLPSTEPALFGRGLPRARKLCAALAFLVVGGLRVFGGYQLFDGGEQITREV
jgi:hypothetical protein